MREPGQSSWGVVFDQACRLLEGGPRSGTELLYSVCSLQTCRMFVLIYFQFLITLQWINATVY